MTERDLHDQLSAWLRKNCIPYSHDRMDKETSNVLGDPDFRCYRGNKVAFVELKVGKNKLSPDQIKRCDELAEAGCTVRVAYDLQSAVSHIERELGLNAATEAPAKPEQASGSPPRIWITSSKTLGDVVVAKNQLGHLGAIRLASEADKKLPRLPVGIS